MELMVCAAYRVRHSEFLSWPVLDRDKAIWQYVRNAETCQQCGTRAQEWDPDKGGRRQAYRAETLQCEGCLRRERAEQALAKEKNSPLGMRVALVRNETEAV